MRNCEKVKPACQDFPTSEFCSRAGKLKLQCISDGVFEQNFEIIIVIARKPVKRTLQLYICVKVRKSTFGSP